MPDRQQLYEGKAKIVYSTDDPQVLISYFKDDATAFNAKKRGQIAGKGEINCAISSHLFRLLEQHGVATHFIDQVSGNEMKVWAVKILPLEVVVRNIAAGSLCLQTGMELGTVLKFPLVDYYYKNDALGDPLLTPDRILLLELATSEQIEQLRHLALQVNQVLSAFFQACGITLVDFKLEFGIDHQQRLLLADEISPDTCRLWNQAETDPDRRVLDKDRFRRDLGEVETAYRQVLERVLSQSAHRGV
ncbi:phosphoribosylaminoimidazolesuccinocarboxamide synthase [Leptolyngbya sp. 'hensonii']|uniref:phosphoribosylaminoimidazolesuccinocarboxamide synthase n=1 Tax=Leptolyngbya sp. 'hensonii' TaxID=1922337 RepID=UPI00094F7897|nr:phosphoribosylaminoimidazolesuccinocarboxamide synthase [Leptolyngbya sp. 'hensonii']OLP17863.1 phosphoribosylaminoimidazolesuccinocarboxamide synthase [Leptolyngbya sp. 'hensonii']